MNATLRIETVLQIVLSSPHGTTSRYTPYLALYMPHAILVVYLGGQNTTVLALLTFLTQPVFSYYSGLVTPHVPGQYAVWSTDVIDCSISAVFSFLGTCRDSTGVFSCHDDRMRRNEQDVLVPLVANARKCIDEIRLSGFFE